MSASVKNKSAAEWERKDLLAIEDLTPAELTTILDTAAAFKTVGTRGSFAGIYRGRDAAVLLVIATFGDRPRFFLMPMERFKGPAPSSTTRCEEAR